jgi:hypothetical protein
MVWYWYAAIILSIIVFIILLLDKSCFRKNKTEYFFKCFAIALLYGIFWPMVIAVYVVIYMVPVIK